MNRKKVALVLASGGARGMAHIGAIEELESRGYEIASIAGCSAGSLIAGVYATGKLQEAKEWFLSLDKQKILSLGDVSLSKHYLVKGDKIREAFQEIVDDCQIEDLPIPVSLVASDIIRNKEVVIESGSLFEGVRASVSIPMFTTTAIPRPDETLVPRYPMLNRSAKGVEEAQIASASLLIGSDSPVKEDSSTRRE